MEKKRIEKEYKKLVDNIENLRMYDGRGTVDRYVCEKCGYTIFTTYKDKGVTPFTIGCSRCGETMFHDKTYEKGQVPEYLVIKDWYRPSLEETLKLSKGMIEHILDGGLILGK